jgi:hypothetical protein
MIRSTRFGFLLSLALLAAPLIASAKTAEKATVVDTGSFGIFVNGQRVATETFNIQQKADVSIATAEVKAADGKNSQHSELQLTPAGTLRRYEWHETSPGKAQAVVEPMDEFLIEKVTLEPGSKPQEKPFILPASTIVLDDYFFSHREILLWRYLAQACGNDIATCRPKKVQFGVLIPHQQISAPVSIEFVGPEKVSIHGVDQELSRFNINSEENVWSVWMDTATMKVIKLTTGNTEVVRD